MNRKEKYTEKNVLKHIGNEGNIRFTASSQHLYNFS